MAHDISPDFTMPGRYILCSKGHFPGLRVYSDGTMALTRSHHTADDIMTNQGTLDDLDLEAVFRLAPFGSDFADTPSYPSLHVDCLGGKAGDSAAVDILDSWTALQFQQPEDEHLLHQPQPLQILLATPRRSQPAEITARESDDVRGFSVESEVFSDNESDAQCSESSGFWVLHGMQILHVQTPHISSLTSIAAVGPARTPNMIPVIEGLQRTRVLFFCLWMC